MVPFWLKLSLKVLVQQEDCNYQAQTLIRANSIWINKALHEICQMQKLFWQIFFSFIYQTELQVIKPLITDSYLGILTERLSRSLGRHRKYEN